MGDILNMTNSVVVKLEFFKFLVSVQTFNFCYQVFAQTQSGEIWTLFESFYLRYSKTHAIFYLLHVRTDWTVLWSKQCILNWLLFSLLVSVILSIVALLFIFIIWVLGRVFALLFKFLGDVGLLWKYFSMSLLLKIGLRKNLRGLERLIWVFLVLRSWFHLNTS